MEFQFQSYMNSGVISASIGLISAHMQMASPRLPQDIDVVFGEFLFIGYVKWDTI